MRIQMGVFSELDDRVVSVETKRPEEAGTSIHPVALSMTAAMSRRNPVPWIVNPAVRMGIPVQRPEGARRRSRFVTHEHTAKVSLTPLGYAP